MRPFAAALATEPDGLFDAPDPLPPKPQLSPDRRRTLRQHQQVEAGIHPLTGGKTFPGWGTCGDCRWRVLAYYHGRSYPKCTFPETDSAETYEVLGPPRATHGAATDVRAWWPACADFEPGDPKLSPDAARWTP